MPGRCAPSFSPKPLTSLTAASPTHRGERMHGVTPIGRKRIASVKPRPTSWFFAQGASVHRSFRHEPRGALRHCPSSLRRTARKGRLTLKRKHFRESLSLHCVTRHPSFAVCSGNASISLSLLVSSTSPKTDTRPAHLDYTPAPRPDARCDDALTPFRQSANHFTHSELPTA